MTNIVSPNSWIPTSVGMTKPHRSPALNARQLILRSARPACPFVLVGFLYQLLIASPAVWALPSGGQVAGGAASIQSNGQTTTIQQQSDRALLNWQGFSIGQKETVQFLQPSTTSLAVNRVLGGDPSIILGNLLANGRVFLLNPNGVVFGPGSIVNVGGLLATTLGLQNYDLEKGKFSFAQDPTKALSSVMNQGTLRVADHGFVTLTAPGVVNEGLIVAKFGQVGLHAGTQMAVDFRGDGLINYAVDGKVLGQVTDPTGRPLTSAITNAGRIEADGGTVLLTAQASSALLSSVINQTGVIQARRLENQGGEIVLKGGDEGIVVVAGALNARGETSEKGEKGETGGVINVTGNRVLLLGEAHADGAQGGRITVQADKVLQTGALTADGSIGDGGAVAINATSRIIQTESALISAHGSGSGTGGTIVLQAGTDGGVFTSGTLLANGQRGGTIQVLGSDLTLAAATGDASGNLAGGTILIGGDYQGHGDVPHAATTLINPFTTLKADAAWENGPGGKIIVWSDKETQFYGSALARGGPNAGDGGLIEVSSKDTLYFGGTGDAGASAGSPGLLLLDPKNITISNSGSIPQYNFNDPNPSAGDNFGVTVVPLNTGKVVITASGDDFGGTDAGAVYLFNGSTGGLVSMLNGSDAGDQVGSGGVTALTNGHYVVASPNWNGKGAVTWGNGTSGITGLVSAANSLVGSLFEDGVGSGGVTALTNGNFVVASPIWGSSHGAVTWGNGSDGSTVGVVSAANSLVGNVFGDQVGSGGVKPLPNGNYVVASPVWQFNVDGLTPVGAVTWGNGTMGSTVGPVSAANSLVGSFFQDRVGSGGVAVLANGNYVVNSPNWNFVTIDVTLNRVGAVTWGNGTTGTTGPVSVDNSLVGSTANDQIGSGGITALANGNYVVASATWTNIGAANAGAVTWAPGTAALPGAVSAANSLVGTTANDQVGSRGVTALTNGHYVVSSPFWNGVSAVEVGAVTWGNGVTGSTIGPVSAANSLVGSQANDRIGVNGVTALTNGNYVVASPSWHNGAVVDAGAVTWGNGTTGTTGVVSDTNSLVGTANANSVGWSVTALTNGHYVVMSSLWDDGPITNAGAVTWGNGLGGTVGPVSVANSLVGNQTADRVGEGGVTALTNGNYVVTSVFWSNGGASEAGAVTWANGATGLSGIVSTGNSLVGSQTNDHIGSGSLFPINGVTALSNGHYVVLSPHWNSDTGAVTRGSGLGGTVGAISAANSLVGSAGEILGGNGLSLDNINGTYLAGGTNRVVAGFQDPSSISFASGGGQSMTIAPSYLVSILATSTLVRLQASNDITVSDAINSASSGGLSLEAGRNVLINANITTSNGEIKVLANQPAAAGVVDTQRDPGAAGITMAGGTTLSSGGGPVTLRIDDGAGLTNNTSGSITVSGINAVAGAISLTADSMSFIGGPNSIIGTGSLTLQPRQPSTSLGMANGTGALALTTTNLNALKPGFSVINLGRADGTGAVTVGSSGYTFQDPVAIRSGQAGGPGNITVNGPLMTTGSDSLTLEAGAQITVGAAGTLTVGTGPLSLTADTMALTGIADSIQGSGALLLQPRQTTTSIGLGDSAPGTFNLTSTALLSLKDGFSSITIGRSDGQHTISINAVTFRDPVTIRTPVGGSILVNGTLTGTGNASMTLIGSGHTTMLNSDITTAGQSIDIQDSVIVAGGAGTTRTLDTTNGGTVPAGANVRVTGTINAQTAAPNNESLTAQAGSTGNVELGVGNGTYDQPIGGVQRLNNLTVAGANSKFPPTTLSGAFKATGKNIVTNGTVISGLNSAYTMTGAWDILGDVNMPGATITMGGPVTVRPGQGTALTIDVSTGSVTFVSAVTTINPDTHLPSDFTLRANSINLLGDAGSVTGNGTNVLELAPGIANATLDIAVASGTGTLQLSETDLNALGIGASGFQKVRLGRSDGTAAVTVGTFVAHFPLTLEAKAAGGSIVVNGDLATSGALPIGLTMEAGKNIALNPGVSVTTNNGPLTLTANALGTATGNFVGIDVNGATLSSGSGALSMTGIGGTSGTNNYGVQLRGAAQLHTTSGPLTLNGTGGTGGTSRNVGAHLEGGSLVTSSSGPITITGHGGNGGGQFNRGVDLLGPGTIVSSTSGPIVIQGTGGANASFSYGVAMAQGQVRSGGDIHLTGQGGAGGPGTVAPLGMLITNGSQVEGLGTASVTLTGTGGTGTSTSATNGEVGVFMHGQNGTFIRTANGDLTINGTGRGTGIGGQGVILRAGALVESTGTGNVSVTGIGSTTGSANSNGIQMIEAGTTVRANAGNLTLMGTAHGALNSTNNIGTAIASGALVQKTGTGGTVSISGTGGDGGGGANNFGVALLSAPTQILANDGTITITGTGGTGGAAGVTAQGGFTVGAPGIPCGSCAPSANINAGGGGTITILSTP